MNTHTHMLYMNMIIKRYDILYTYETFISSCLYNNNNKGKYACANYIILHEFLSLLGYLVLKKANKYLNQLQHKTITASLQAGREGLTIEN